MDKLHCAVALAVAICASSTLNAEVISSEDHSGLNIKATDIISALHASMHDALENAPAGASEAFRRLIENDPAMTRSAHVRDALVGVTAFVTVSGVSTDEEAAPEPVEPAPLNFLARPNRATSARSAWVPHEFGAEAGDVDAR